MSGLPDYDDWKTVPGDDPNTPPDPCMERGCPHTVLDASSFYCETCRPWHHGEDFLDMAYAALAITDSERG